MAGIVRNYSEFTVDKLNNMTQIKLERNGQTAFKTFQNHSTFLVIEMNNLV